MIRDSSEYYMKDVEEPVLTPQMIAAGCKALSGFVALDLYEGFISSEEVARSIFSAMWKARLKELSVDTLTAQSHQ